MLVSDIACIDRFVDDIAHQQVLVVVLSIVTQQECVEFVPRSTVQISAILAEWCFFQKIRSFHRMHGLLLGVCPVQSDKVPKGRGH